MTEFGQHVGGLTSGGLGWTEIGNKAAIGGFAHDFYKTLGKHYGREANERFGETLNGVRGTTLAQQFGVPVDPDVRPGGPATRERPAPAGHARAARRTRCGRPLRAGVQLSPLSHEQPREPPPDQTAR